MTREEQLTFCRKCLNREMDLQQGIICNLTKQKASFEKECPDFKLDESVKEKPADDKEGLHQSEIKEKLSPELFEKLRLDQNLPFGIIAGFIAAIIGAVIWGIITVSTGFQIGYMALAIGALVGITIRITGKGIDQIFGFWGAGIALFGVVLGNFLSIIGFIANAEGLGYFETLTLLDYNYVPELMAETFSIIDLVFYGIAIYEGYRFSFRQVTEKDIQEIRIENK
ncbi:MAG: hypothetical protein H8D45_26845 [Bacteroidetes bacterium]|nr:hypothetical protein [Bacteroidota bacterium]MBL7103446.1 hypothetical protein [Bacteroidales bacterium]